MVVAKHEVLSGDALIAEQHDRRARKDATLNMRINSELLEEVKAAAKAEGVDKYQSWITMILECAVIESKGIQVNKTA